MICEYCNTEHPLDQIADPHYCIARLNERVEEIEEALEWVIPMAKGYASEHPVGRNQEIVNEAEAKLKGGKP